MSEPVGNGPRRLGDVPGNSHKAREAGPGGEGKLEEPREAPQKIVAGKVVKRKTPWYKRAMRGLIADDAQSIGQYLLIDVVQPSIKTLLGNMIHGTTDQLLWGQSRHRRSGGMGGGGTSSLRTRYDRMSDPGEPRRAISQTARARHDFDDIILDDREEAIEVVEALINRVAQYRAASVADLYDYVGVTGSYADRNYGWTNLETANVRQHGAGWLLDLPRPQPLGR